MAASFFSRLLVLLVKLSSPVARATQLTDSLSTASILLLRFCSSHAVRSCSPHLVCYDFHHQHPHHQQLFCQHRTTDPNPPDNITTRVDKIEEELNHIRAFISPSESPVLTSPSDSTPCQSNVAPVEVDDIPDDQDVDHNSMASVEEYIPSVSDFCFEDNQLNSIVPTNQLQ